MDWKDIKQAQNRQKAYENGTIEGGEGHKTMKMNICHTLTDNVPRNIHQFNQCP